MRCCRSRTRPRTKGRHMRCRHSRAGPRGCGIPAVRFAGHGDGIAAIEVGKPRARRGRLAAQVDLVARDRAAPILCGGRKGDIRAVDIAALSRMGDGVPAVRFAGHGDGIAAVEIGKPCARRGRFAAQIDHVAGDQALAVGPRRKQRNEGEQQHGAAGQDAFRCSFHWYHLVTEGNKRIRREHELSPLFQNSKQYWNFL